MSARPTMTDRYYEIPTGTPEHTIIEQWMAQRTAANNERKALCELFGADGLFGNEGMIHGLVFPATAKPDPKLWTLCDYAEPPFYKPCKRTKAGRSIAALLADPNLKLRPQLVLGLSLKEEASKLAPEAETMFCGVGLVQLDGRWFVSVRGDDPYQPTPPCAEIKASEYHRLLEAEEERRKAK